MREKIVDGDFDGRFGAKLRKETRNSLVLKSSSRMKASTQNVIQKLKAVVFEEVEVDFWDLSELNCLLPLLARVPIPMWRKDFKLFETNTFCSTYSTMKIATLVERKEVGWVEEV